MTDTVTACNALIDSRYSDGDHGATAMLLADRRDHPHWHRARRFQPSATGAPAIVAVGRDLHPERFGRQPPHVRVEQFVDFDVVIPRASVVLHHGGSGLFLRSVMGGAPQIVLTMGADRPFTADSVSRIGLGRVLDPITATAQAIAEMITELLADERSTAPDRKTSPLHADAPETVHNRRTP